MTAIGGYFGLFENQPFNEYHRGLLGLNTGRNALEHIIIKRQYRKVYIPYFTCDVLLEPLKKHNLEIEFYTINGSLEPRSIPEIGENEAFLYTNYFGVKNSYIEKLGKLVRNLIIDNAQSFFSKPLQGIDTFYSPRKFFGVPDGAYVSTDSSTTPIYIRDISSDRCTHLLHRVDYGAATAYSEFKLNEEALINQPIKRMSKLTQTLLSCVDYKLARKKRNENFSYLHAALEGKNKLDFLLSDIDGPMVYPFYTDSTTLRAKLLENKVFVATYWSNVFKWVTKEFLEFELSHQIIPLPVDQRYGSHEMEKILSIIARG